MRSFGELLVDYTRRAGISDAELARSIGVQRQTIFRWKEGLVARPRYREDVLKIAAKLRLDPGEQDELLLAAGFPPEAAAAPAGLEPASAVRDDSVETAAAAAPMAPAGQEISPSPRQQAPQAASGVRRLRPLLGWGAAALAGAILILGGIWGAQRIFRVPAQPTPTPMQVNLGVLPTLTSAATATPIVAGPGEKLIVVAPFVGYTAGELRYNVAGRIQEALAAEVQDSHLADVRVVIWPQALAARDQAAGVLQQSKGAGVIWGEYDAGRVRASFLAPDGEDANWVNPVQSPSDLSLIINEQVPAGARMLALFALGRLYRHEGDAGRALAAFEKALSLKPEDQTTEAALHFYLGTLLPAVRGQTPAVLTDAIAHFSQALVLQPAWENVLYNRGTAYLARGLLSNSDGPDLTAAIGDLSAVIQRQPTRREPLLNRGIAYYQRDSAGDLAAAISDFRAAAALSATDAAPYYHLGLAQIRAADTPGWTASLQKAASLDPTAATVQNAFCWGYGLDGNAQAALPYCMQAVATDLTGSSLDSRALSYAQLGKYDLAQLDLRNYLAWVRKNYPDLYAKFRGPQVETWIQQLDRGVNPFTPEVRAALRHE